MQYPNIKNKLRLSAEFNVIIEIAMNSGPVKYEFDKNTETMIVDRFIQSSMHYPCNYGFIPNTLSGDGDPIDVLVYTNYPIAIKSIINVKPIGVLITEDESGLDEKILSVPTARVDPYFKEIVNYTDLPTALIQKISHFFKTYKDLEDGKWVRVDEWKNHHYAKKIIQTAIDNYNDNRK